MYRDLSSLRELQILEDVELKRISNETFKSLVNVETIILKDCSISDIDPDAFGSLHKLKLLALTGNYLTRFSSVNLPVNLEELILCSNRFDSIEAVVNRETASRLLILELSENKIESLHANSFSSLVALRSLELAGNALNSISDEAFGGLVNLRELDLQTTGIKTISGRLLASTPKLRKLNLYDTRLESIDQNAFDQLRNVLSVTLLETDPTHELLRPFRDNRQVEMLAFIARSDGRVFD
jgi:Leucine-rich repeat (LRR) protein